MSDDIEVENEDLLFEEPIEQVPEVTEPTREQLTRTPQCREVLRKTIEMQISEFVKKGGQVLELPPDTSSAGSLIF